MLAGTTIYQLFLKQYEVRSLAYVSCFIGLLTKLIDMLQIYRVNIKLGISDMTMLCFGSSVIYAF